MVERSPATNGTNDDRPYPFPDSSGILVGELDSTPDGVTSTVASAHT